MVLSVRWRYAACAKEAKSHGVWACCLCHLGGPLETPLGAALSVGQTAGPATRHASGQTSVTGQRFVTFTHRQFSQLRVTSTRDLLFLVSLALKAQSTAGSKQRAWQAA